MLGVLPRCCSSPLSSFVLTLNSINSSKTKITEATVEAARLNAQANSLGPYGDFAKIKAERVKSVRELAKAASTTSASSASWRPVLPSGRLARERDRVQQRRRRT